MVSVAPTALVVGLLTILGALGLPLGMPPLPPDPVVLRATPDECLWHMSWAGTAEPNAANPNRSEQILASPEVRQFVKEFGQQLTSAAKQSAQGDPRKELAADTVPGILHGVFNHPTAIYLSKLTKSGDRMEMSGGMVVNFGAEGSAVIEKINKLRDAIQASQPDAQSTQVTIGGVEFRKYPADEQRPESYVGFQGSLMIAAWGTGEVEALVARLQGSGPPPKWYQELHQKMAIDRPAVTSYVNMAKIFEAAGPALADPQVAKVMDALGLAQITSIGSVSGLTSTVATSKTLIATRGEPQGVLAFIPTKPLTLDDLKAVPQNATYSVILRLDPAEFLQKVVELATKIDPSAQANFEMGLGMAQQQLGLNVVDDVLKPLGDSWTISVLPSPGAMPGTTIVGTVTLDDRGKFVQSHDQLLAMAKAMLAADGSPDAPTLSESMVGETKVYTVTSRELSGMKPSWCITDKHLVVGANPALVEQYLKRDPAGPTLADVKAFQVLFGRSAPTIVTYQDTLALLRQLYPLAQFFGPVAVGQLAPMGIQVQMPTLPNPEKLAPHITPNVSLTGRRPDGLMIERFYSLPLNVDIATLAPAALPVLLPAIDAARQAAKRIEAINQLKQIGLGMLVHESAKQTLPASAIYKDGKPLLSWRVAILPYLEEQALYEQFHLDEPWDSEHNSKLIGSMPAIYAHPDSKELNAQFKTRFLAPTGENALFNGEKGSPLARVTDGTSNTIMTVIAAPERAVVWTKPDDLAVDAKNPLTGLGIDQAGYFQALFADGSVRRITQNIDPEMLRRLFNPRDGQVAEVPNE